MADSRDKPELETLDYKPHKDDRGYGMDLIPAEKPDEDELSKLAGEQDAVGQLTEQPNKNLMIIEEIEGLMSQVNEKIRALDFNSKNSPRISLALEEIDLFQKTTLFELRKAFE